MTPSGMQAFRWSATGGMVGLGFLPGSTNRPAAAISNGGPTNAACITLPSGSSAAGVSSNGLVIVGGSGSILAYQAFRWTAASGMVGLGKLPGSSRSEAEAVSSDGSVVVGHSNMGWTKSHLNSEAYSSCEAFRWTAAEGMVGLGHLPARKITYPMAISCDGSIVMGWHGLASSPYFEAFIWDSVNGMRNLQSLFAKDYHLDFTGWKLQWACGLSSDRRTLIGMGVHNGCSEAWIAHLDRPLNETGKAKGK
jgi:probable HAF family extracellular repeat protein